MAKTEDRFLKTYDQGNAFGTKIQIWVDRQTGVNYLWQDNGGYAGGLTPLLNSDGSPIVTPVPRRYEE